jgi:hypothetical protein
MSDDLLFYEYLYQHIQKRFCFVCNISGTNYRTSCGHYFHLSCLVNYYHYNPACPECRNIICLDFVQMNEIDKCFICSSTSYLQKFDCFHFYCAFCLLREKPRLECCKKTEKNYLKFILNCSLCEEKVSLDNCSSVTCKEHGIICKKCHNYSFLNKECIGKCGRKVNNAYVSYCFSCSNQEVIHFSNKKCISGCEVCINCFLWFFINFGPSEACYICSENLIEYN